MKSGWQATNWKRSLAIWLLLIMYILFGGWLFHNYEAEAERISAEDYCRSMDLSLKKMEPHQRESFSKVLNNLVNSGLCRAPSCSVAPLDTLSVKFSLCEYELTLSEARGLSRLVWWLSAGAA
jgi:hypothetical protein